MTALAYADPPLERLARVYPRRFRHEQHHGANMPKQSLTKSHRIIAERAAVSEVVRLCFGSAKAAAASAGCHPNTVKAWGASEPSLHHFLAMARANPAFRAEAARLIGLEGAADPLFMRAFITFMQAMSARAGK